MKGTELVVDFIHFDGRKQKTGLANKNKRLQQELNKLRKNGRHLIDKKAKMILVRSIQVRKKPRAKGKNIREKNEHRHTQTTVSDYTCVTVVVRQRAPSRSAEIEFEDFQRESSGVSFFKLLSPKIRMPLSKRRDATSICF